MKNGQYFFSQKTGIHYKGKKEDFPDCNEEWFTDDEYHRDNDLPAVIWENGSKFWLWHNKRHRLYAPAQIYLNGSIYWFVNDVDITNEVIEWCKKNNYPHWEQWDDITKLHFKMTFT